MDQPLALVLATMLCPECGSAAETLPPEAVAIPSSPNDADSVSAPDGDFKADHETPTITPRHAVHFPDQTDAGVPPVRDRHEVPVPSPPSVPGGMVRYFGDYELLALIARGGMGVVYKARQVKLNRLVAVKMILAGQLASELDVERFHVEARAAANLQHPNIVAIYEIGEHAGQHYFSMEYVEGRSLADVVRDSPLPAKEAARIVAILADAIHYAHQRGVLHRDLKPSNVLMAVNGPATDARHEPSQDSAPTVRPLLSSLSPKVTDFGLAKRIEGGSDLTGTGQVLGTPSYMPPEQAAGKHGAFGPYSDVYSIGAVLYECVTGRPPFRAETPLDTIMQVLDVEPVSPRQLNPKLPKDVETICLKCLHKEPKLRYQTAVELADDLRRFSNNEPIQARPVSAPERLLYWTKRQRRIVGLAIAAVVATLLLGIVGLATWYSITTANLGRIAFTTSGPPLVAELYKPGGRFVAREAVPSQQFILPAGPYDVRVSARGVFSRVFQTDVQRRSAVTHDVTLADRILWEKTIDRRSMDLQVAGPDGSPHAVLLSNDGKRLDVARIDPATGTDRWRVNWPADSPPWGDTVRPEDAVQWKRLFEQSNSSRIQWQGLLAQDDSTSAYLVRVISSTVRHVGDAVVSTDNYTELLALSANDGRVLWWFHPRPPAGTDPADRQFTVEDISIVADLDGDSQPDLITRSRLIGTEDDAAIETWWEAVAGSTGKSLWRSEMLQRSAEDDSQTYRPIVGSAGDRTIVVIADQTRLLVLDAGTGQPVGAPIEFDGPISSAPQAVDLDGDGQSEELLVGVDKLLLAFSLRTRRLLWELPQFRKSSGVDSALWPVVADLDNDGLSEVMVPAQQPTGNVAPWNVIMVGGLEVLEGRTGALRFRRIGAAAKHILIGPDLNGDGSCELFVIGASPHSFSSAVYVHALSGSDGQVFWWRKVQVTDRYGNLEPPRWGQTGPDGWPQLILRMDNAAIVLAAGDGRIVSEAEGIRVADVADFNRDGIPDLCSVLTESPESETQRWRIVRGEPPVRWTRLSTPTPAGDFDGDGIADLFEWQDLGRGSLWRTVSGRTGRMLATLKDAPISFADVDGDSAVEMIVRPQNGKQWSIPLQALSGRTGKVRWTGPSLPRDSAARSDVPGARWTLRDWFLISTTDLDGDSSPELLAGGTASYEVQGTGGVFAAPRIMSAAMPIEQQFWLAAFSGRDRQLRWSTRLMGLEAAGAIDSDSTLAPPAVADLDGDGVRDLLFGVPTHSGSDRVARTIIALNGRNGQTIWQVTLTEWPIVRAAVPIPGQDNQFPRHRDLRFTPLVEDFDGDGVLEVAATDCTLEISESLADSSSELLGISTMIASSAATAFTVSGPIRVRAFNARDGRQIREWQGGNHSYRTAPGELLRLVSVPLGQGGKPAAMLLVRDARGASQTVLLDDQFHERALPLQSGFDWHRIRSPRSADLDGDGSNDLVFECESAVWAVRGGDGHVLWRWPTTTPHADETDEADETDPVAWTVRDVVSWNGGPAMLVLQMVRDESAHGHIGLDGRTGRPVWRSEGWPLLTGVPAQMASAPIHSAGLAHLPSVLRHLPDEAAVSEGTAFASSCEMSLPADESGKYRLPDPEAISYARAPAYPWELRCLPWTCGPGATGSVLVRVAGFAAAHALMLLIMPGWLLVWAVRNRTWTMSGLMGVPVVVALMIAFVHFSEAHPLRLDDLEFGLEDSVMPDSRLMALLVRADPTRFMRDYNRLGVVPSEAGGRLIRLAAFAVGGLPLLAFPYLVFTGLMRRRWRHVLTLIGLSCALSIAAALLLLWDDRQWLASFQRYSLDGWSYVWLLGAYGTTLLFLAWRFGRLLVDWPARLFRAQLYSW